MRKVFSWLFTNYKGEKVGAGWLLFNLLVAVVMLGAVFG